MAKTKIKWCDYTINPVKGLCPVGCSYCYARRMYKRFHWNPEIRMEPDWPEDLRKEPSKIFIGSTMELFGDWVQEWMYDEIWKYVNDFPQHAFVFLTKRPENLIKWSPFPENCWVGVSATDYTMASKARWELGRIKAKVKFLSLEPMLGEIADRHGCTFQFHHDFCSWLIIGQQTPVSAKTQPKIEWIEEIINAADNAGIPVFLKNNLKPFLDSVPTRIVYQYGSAKLRQEFPHNVGQSHD